MATVLLLLIGVSPGRAVSQQGSLYALREGSWAGESVAFADLTGSTPEGSATYVGTVESQFSMVADKDGVVDGGWILDGSGFMQLQGSAPGTITFVSSGAGGLTGDPFPLRMQGEITTNGVITTPNGALSMTGVPSAIDLDVMLTAADCTQLSGDWIFPLEQLAADNEWSTINIDGFFYATYLGDGVDDQIIGELEQLWDDQKQWGDALVAGTGDIGGAWALIGHAQSLAAQLADAEACLFPRIGDPSTYLVRFSVGVATQILTALLSREFAGAELYSASLVMASLGDAHGMERPVSDTIQRQAQRIMDANLASDGDTCDPCLVSGEGSDAASAALAGHTLGHTYEINGYSYTPERILWAVTVFEGATGQ